MKHATIHTMDQNTPEWYAIRAGKLTASVAAKVVSKLKSGGEPAGRRDLRMRIVAERLTGKPISDDYQSQWMQRGSELQPEALAAYELHTSQWVEPAGFVSHNTLLLGCSPDGLIDGGQGGVELKVPKASTHIEYLRTGGVPADYVAQVQHSIYLCDADWWDFVSYCPDLPEALQLFVVRVVRDDKAINEYERQALAFLKECDVELEALQTMVNLRTTLRAAVAVTAT